MWAGPRSILSEVLESDRERLVSQSTLESARSFQKGAEGLAVVGMAMFGAGVAGTETLGAGVSTISASAPSALPITGFAGSQGKNLYHALDRAIERGVSPQAILQTLKNPTVVVEQAGGRVLYLTQQAAVVLDRSGQAVTIWGGAQHGEKTLELLKAAGGVK